MAKQPAILANQPAPIAGASTLRARARGRETIDRQQRRVGREIL